MKTTITDDICEFLESDQYNHYIDPKNKLTKRQLAERITNIIYCKLFLEN